jgi:hypothetical protein
MSEDYLNEPGRRDPGEAPATLPVCVAGSTPPSPPNQKHAARQQSRRALLGGLWLADQV